MVQGVEVLAIIEIPQHCLGVLTTRGAERAIRGHGDCVQVASVADVVGLQLAVGQVPHLDVLVPPGGDDDRVLVVGLEPDAGDPVLVAILLDCVLALGKGVPQLEKNIFTIRCISYFHNLMLWLKSHLRFRTHFKK